MIPKSNIYFGENGRSSFSPIKDTSFTVMDISTKSKGPIYTIVKGNGQRLNREIQGIKLEMYYHIKDTPPEIDEAYFETYIDFNTSNPYGIYPLIKQILLVDEFLENQSYDDHQIHLSRIIFKSIKEDKVVNKITDKSIRNVLETYDLITDMNSIIGDNQFIAYEVGRWSNSNKKKDSYEITDYFDTNSIYSAFICFPDIETAYCISSSVYTDFLSLSNINVDILYEKRIYNKKKSISENIIEEFENDKYQYTRGYYANSLEEIFKICIFVPQLIMIERYIYEVDPTITITIEKNNRIASLTIKKEEYSIDFSIYDILVRMCILIR